MVISEEFIRIFWKCVDKRGPDECWNWVKGVHHSGYGICCIDRKSCIASRVSYKIANGNIPDGMWVLHTCDNKKCVNPNHLWLGNNSDNQKDSYRKGRGAGFKKGHTPYFHDYDGQTSGERNGSHILTNDIVYKIRNMLNAGCTQRSIAIKFGVKKECISKIKTGRTWRHLLERGQDVTQIS